MRFVYVPRRGRRLIEGLVFEAANDWQAEVQDVELAAQLVTYPGEQFELVEVSKAERKALEKALGAELEFAPENGDEDVDGGE